MTFASSRAATSSRGATRWRTGRLSAATIRRKLSAVASLFDYLCERNAVKDNPVHGVTRPSVENANEGKTPAIGDAQARALLDSPDPGTLRGKRDRAILATFLYHGLRREELCRLRLSMTSSIAVAWSTFAISRQGREAAIHTDPSRTRSR
jgi:site-specific recombinase XerD